MKHDKTCPVCGRDGRDESTETLFLKILNAIGNEQVELITWIAGGAGGPETIDAFEAAGGTRELFEEVGEDAGSRGDFDAIFWAIKLAHDRQLGRFFAVRSAMAFLQRIDCWSDADDWGGGFVWSARRLVGLFEAALGSSPPTAASRAICASGVREHTARLIELRRRLAEARGHLRQMKRILGEVETDLSTRLAAGYQNEKSTSTRPQLGYVVKIHRRKGKGQCTIARM